MISTSENPFEDSSFTLSTGGLDFIVSGFCCKKGKGIFFPYNYFFF
jgi:hypothetical protein